MLNKKMTFLKIVILLTIMSLSNNIAIACDHHVWQEVEAKIEVSKHNDLTKIKKTVYETLLKANDKKDVDISEADKSILLFKISYPAPIQLKDDKKPQTKTITQTGFYRTLALELQKEYESKGIMNKSIMEHISFKKADPVFINFLLGKKKFAAPALITDSIDIGWLKR